MRSRKRGFTLIEVSLFLAITGALFVAVTIGVQNSIFQQRFNDSVQNFEEFLRTAYAETMNVQNTGNGRSGEAIYGRLITFGEKHGLSGERITDESVNNIYMYDVIGKIGDIGTGNVLSTLNNLSATVTIEKDGEVKPAGIIENYVPRWGAVIEKTDEYKPFVGAILIVRHPNSGVAYTYVKNGETIEVNEMINNANGLGTSVSIDWEAYGFKIEQVDFCVNPVGGEQRSNRQDVRIITGAKNGTGIELVPESAEGYACGM